MLTVKSISNQDWNLLMIMDSELLTAGVINDVTFQQSCGCQYSVQKFPF